MKPLAILLLIVTVFSCRQKTAGADQLIFDRIAYIYNLKPVIDAHTWKGFNDKAFDVPLIYYTDTASFVANPTAKFIAAFKPTLVFENSTIKIYKTSKRVDSIPFHMATGLNSGDSVTSYNYNSPFMNCSSFEITQRTIPDITSTEQWATMIIHEYFHGFQFRHQPFIDYTNRIDIPGSRLQRIYDNNPWFKEKMDKEK